MHTDWNETLWTGPDHPNGTYAGWLASDETSGPACPLPPEHMRWPTPHEQEAELVRRRAKWAREHPAGFPSECRKVDAGVSMDQIIMIALVGTMVLFVVVVNWFLIRRFVTVSLGLLPRLPRLRRVRKGQWSLGPQAALARDQLLRNAHDDRGTAPFVSPSHLAAVRLAHHLDPPHLSPYPLAPSPYPHPPLYPLVN